MMEGTGIVKFMDIEGGFWVIELESGIILRPVQFPKKIQQAGIQVSCTYKEYDGFSFSMTGELVELDAYAIL